MKHAGKARRAGLKLMFWSLLIVSLAVAGWSFLAGRLVNGAALVLGLLWLGFFLFCLNFFRDPEATVPSEKGIFVSPAHGTVDVIDEVTEKNFMGGRCKRISMFLSVFDVHVQNAPVAGRVQYLKHCRGQFLNAMRTDCGEFNENVLVGIETGPTPADRVGVRLIAGLIARRIVPWIAEGDVLEAGQRIALIQFGSRVDLYLPLDTQIRVTLGTKVRGGETIMALRG